MPVLGPRILYKAASFLKGLFSFWKKKHKQILYKQRTLSMVLLSCLSLLVVAEEQAQVKEHIQQHIPSPDWRKQIIYFLMIDRFADGDSSNNDQGQGEYNPLSLKHFNGGDISGVEQHLDYIKNLGATAVWMTPPVQNMWYSSASDYYGYHGYWALDFTKIDPHFGTLADYKSLANALHQNDMYLIQDIVVNHTAPLFGYSDTYDPENTAKHFYLFENGFQAQPYQAPFDKINRLDPADFAAGIYNWTTPISDHNDPTQQYTYQLANLADLNTLNPLVVDTFKETYKYWMSEVGIDAFRIDTVKYAEPEFWSQFLHDDDGIYAHAKKLGKTHFLTFGEVFESSRPMQNDGEQKVTYFLGSEEEPLLNSVIGFPLYFDINAVFAEGKPTAQLAYRLQRFMQDYPDPFTTPNFIDNHDTKRFLAAGNVPAFKQAFTLLMTIPGIPMIYQGSEHAYTATRAPLFATGSTQYPDTTDNFNQDSEMYHFIQELSALRLNNDALTLGDLTILADNPNGQGLLAYQRSYTPSIEVAKQTNAILETAEMNQKHDLTKTSDNYKKPAVNEIEEPSAKAAVVEQDMLVFFNTAGHSILARDISTKLPANTLLKPVLSSHTDSDNIVYVDANQQLQIILPPQSFVIFEAKKSFAEHSDDVFKTKKITNTDLKRFALTYADHYENQIHKQDMIIKGSLSCLPGRDTQKDRSCNEFPETLLVIKNGNYDKGFPIKVSKNGQFSFPVQIRDLGRHAVKFDFHIEGTQLTNSTIRLTTEVTTPTIQTNYNDLLDDAYGPYGPYGNYTNPQHESSKMQREIEKVDIRGAGSILQLELTMAEITDAWLPANGFDNVAFTIFFGNKRTPGLSVLPLLSANMPDDLTWQIGHQIYGWGNSTYSINNATAQHKGDKIGSAPKVSVDKANSTIQLTYDGNSFGVADWSQYYIYITTWDMSGEGEYRPIGNYSNNWQFGGAAGTAPKIMDDVLIYLNL